MSDLHDADAVEAAGTPLADAEAALLLVHGRGASAQQILQSFRPLQRDGVAMLAPQAANHTWYPNSFLAPVETNEPGRSSGLSVIESTLDRIEDAGIPAQKVIVIGFSQGACLASEYVARNPRRYGGLAVLSGGLIGEKLDEESFSGSLERTPVFLGCSDIDPHIPIERVEETAAVFSALDADLTKQIYEGMGHTVNQDEFEHVSKLVDALLA